MILFCHNIQFDWARSAPYDQIIWPGKAVIRSPWKGLTGKIFWPVRLT
jgi:hypothetical protein